MIYFVTSSTPNLVKIGYTDGEIAHRFSVIQMHSPVPLKLAATGEGSRRTEGWLHKIFAPQRSHGEWFRLEGPLVELLMRIVVRGPAYLAEFLRDVPLETEAVDIHGTISGYIGRRCRCDRCVSAWRTYQREYQKNKRNQSRARLSQ